MAWNQKHARFYCRVQSARKDEEVILSDAYTGLNVTAAGEYGAIRLSLSAAYDSWQRGLHTPERKEGDKFCVELIRWRNNESAEGPLLIAEGTLNYDRQRAGGGMVRLGPDVWETYSMLKAREIMKGK